MRIWLRTIPLAAALAASSLFAQTAASAQTNRTDDTALQLFEEVTAKYARAVRSHIESVTETTHTSEMFYEQLKQINFEYEEPGNKYRFGGRDQNGNGLVVSDGTTEWEYHSAQAEYIKRPAGTFGHPFPRTVDQYTEGPEERNSYFMRKNFVGVQLKSAHWQPDETIPVGGKMILCWRIAVHDSDFFGYTPQPNAASWIRTYWIDKARKLIVKMEVITVAKIGGAPDADSLRSTTTITYPVVSLDEPIPDDAFTFTPPARAKLVDNFVNPYAVRPAPAAAVRQPPPPPNYVGTSAPNLLLTAGDGTKLQLSSLRGKPVLLDLWATWCGPCLLEMPTIDRIYRYGKPAGLTVLGVDQDKNPNDAVAYLKTQDYGWKDFHDGWNGRYEHLGVDADGGMPLLMLIDADGKIVYFHSGAEDDEGLLAAVRHLGPAFDAAIDASEK